MTQSAPLWRSTLCETVDAVRARRHGCADAVRAALTRCAALEPAVQAWEHLDAARALDVAEAADARLRSGAPVRLLEGVPLGIKDIIDVAGMPTRLGSPIMAGNVPELSARCVARLEAAGAIVLGKTVTTEFAYYSPGRTRNPWNTAHTPGGSSSGSAAAVACGMVAGALGTQTNGSVIRPAAFCGVIGYKPGIGVVSSHGTMDPWPSLDHTGVFARTVGDAALLAHVIADTPIPPTVHANRAPRLVAVRSPVWALAEDYAQSDFTDTVGRLRRAGAEITERELPAAFDEAHAALRTLMAFEAHRHFQALRNARGNEMSAQLRALIDEGAQVNKAAYDRARSLQLSLRETFAAFVSPFDAVVTLPAPGEAPATLEQTGNPAFCSIWSLLGVPAITLPVALGPHGLPLGVQIASASGAEAAALNVAAWCEARLESKTFNILDRE